MSEFNESNFFMNTKATFTPCAKPRREADYVSASGSMYWYDERGVVRSSNHWGSCVASCDWFIAGDEDHSAMHDANGERAAFASWDEFEMASELSVCVYRNCEFIDDVAVTPAMMKNGKISTEYGTCAFDAFHMMAICL